MGAKIVVFARVCSRSPSRPPGVAPVGAPPSTPPPAYLPAYARNLGPMSKRNQGWIPQQHGAWAMLAVPAVLGIAARLRTGAAGWDLVALPLVWFLGYFAFWATSLMIKAAPRRRHQFRAPALTYTALAAVAGVAVLLIDGVGVAWWLLPYAPLLLGTLLLVWQRQERSLASGALSTAAASLFAMVLYRPHADDVVEGWVAGDIIALRWLVIVCFLYFLGTVFAVKTMIRERSSLPWFVASLGYHAACVGVAALGYGIGRLPWAWIAFFAATFARALALPLVGPRRGRSVRPAVLGAIEVVFSVALVVLALWLGPQPA